MSGEIKVVASIQVDNTPDTGPQFSFPRTGGGQVLIDQGAPGGGNPGAFDVTIAWRQVDFGDLDVLGMCRWENNSDTYTVQLGVGDGSGDPSIFGKMYPNEPYLGRLEPDSSYWVRIDPETFPVGSGSGSGSGGDIARITINAMED